MPFEELGPYRVLRLLKAGGEGTVYAAEDRRLGRRVAIKLRTLPDGLDARRAVIAEAELLATLSNPHIVQLYDVVETDGALALVMEYIAGNDLEELIASTRLDLESVLQVGLDLCSALASAHEKGVIHGDLKPANVLLDTTGRIKLTDFGVAFHQYEPPATGGTPSILSPERRARERCDARADLFALGCLLHRLLSPGPLSDDVPAQVSPDHPPSPGTLGASLPVRLVALIDKLLAPVPAERPGSALEVRQTLLEIARDYPAGPGLPHVLPGGFQDGVAAPPDLSPREKASPSPQKKTTRNRRPGVLLAGFLLIGLGLLAGLVLIQGPSSASPIDIVLQTREVERAESVELSPETLSALLGEAIERHPRLRLVTRTLGGSDVSSVELWLRCNRYVCSSRLVRSDADLRRADTRALLPDASPAAWADAFDQGLAVLFPVSGER